jgi:hypothetical protein
VLLQASLLHMLLPLQQALLTAEAAAADTSASTGRQTARLAATGDCAITNPQPHDVNNAHAHMSDQGLDLAVQMEVLRRVQGFVSGLADARLEQQQQVLPQLQQQLQQLAATVDVLAKKQEPGDSTNTCEPGGHITNATSSSSSSDRYTNSSYPAARQ